MRWIVIMLLFFVTAASAQDGGMGEMDKKYIPPVGSLFHTDKKTTSNNGFDAKNIVKFDLGLLTRGVVGLEYERSVVGSLSVLGGVGLSLFPDYVVYARTAVYESIELAEPITEGVGSYFRGGFRLNIGDMGDGSFMGLGARIIRHNYIDEGRSERSYTQTSRDAFYEAGTQLSLGGGSTAELSLATGYRFLTAYHYDLDRYDAGQFFLLMTVKIGFGF